MQVGSDEILLDDTLRVAEAAKRAGCDVSVEVADGMMHVFQMLTWLVPNAQAALNSAALFIDRHLGKKPFRSTEETRE
jgi:acetyl esterase/lipase